MQNISSNSSLLQQAKIDIEIEAPVANTQLTQTFINQTEDIIEAVYNFPVPRQAVIMQVIVTINGEVFTGQIKPVADAEESYEEGIEQGKRSVLVRDIGDGQHELRAGNLAPEDCLVIHIHITQLMQAQPGGYRYFLPTVIAPKYGHAQALHDVAHQHSLLADYPFSAHLQIKNNAAVNCVSHTLEQHGEGYQFDGALDQDIVLSVASHHRQPFTIQSLQGEYPCALSVLPPQSSVESDAAVSIVLLIDCSGSMAGLSMQQTQAGLTALLTGLKDNSEVSLMCFGSDVMHVNPKPLTINAKSRKVLLKFVSKISADMGGTNIWDALTAAQTQGEKHLKTPEIIVLTDGQVWDNPAYFANVSLERTERPEQCRVNTIGIGSAVSEDIVIKVAQATYGQWILVHPNEPMGERISHFIAQVSAPRMACLWQTDNALWSALPLSASAVHGGVGYVAYKSGTSAVGISLHDVVLPQTELTGNLAVALQKLVGQQHVFALDKIAATALSLQLGLVNEHTSFVMVNEKIIENADGLPSLAVVPQMASLELGLDLLDSNFQIHTDEYRAPVKEQAYESYELPVLSESYINPLHSLRRDVSSDNTKDNSNVQTCLSSTLLSKISASGDGFESVVLKKVDKKLTRTLLKGKIPSLEILITWGFNQDIADAIQEYFNQHKISDPQCYLAKVLLWLNSQQDILSSASIDILQNKVDGAAPKDLVAMAPFIRKLEEIDVCTF